MVWNHSYLKFQFSFKCTCSLVLELRNLYLVLATNIIMLRKGKDTMDGNLSLYLRSNIFSVRLFPCII